MAVYFNLAANFETSEKDAKEFVNYFSKKKIILSDGNTVPLEGSFTKLENNEFIAVVYPEKMSMGSPMGSNYALLEKPFDEEIDKWFYHELKEFPFFSYAFFGGEAYDTFLDISFTTEILKGPHFPWKGLVVKSEFWNKMGKPNLYKPFCDGYLWIPKVFGNFC